MRLLTAAEAEWGLSPDNRNSVWVDDFTSNSLRLSNRDQVLLKAQAKLTREETLKQVGDWVVKNIGLVDMSGETLARNLAYLNVSLARGELP